jgi:16S rRNA (guanine527-N7)-methyltransferase
MSDDSLRARIQAGSARNGLGLDSHQIDQLVQYLSHLARWNRTINLTALPLSGYPAASLDRLIFEPLKSVPAFVQDGPLRWVDFGSGGGSPAIPLRIMLPAASLTMIESRSRKTAFLRDVVRLLGFTDVQVLWNRVETLEGLIQAESVDILTIRALRIDEGVLEVVRHLLRETGRLLLFGPVDKRHLSKHFRLVERRLELGEVTVLQKL